MRKITKIFLFIVILNFVVGAGILTYIASLTFGPSFKEAGVTFKDILKPHMDPVKREKLDQAMSKRSSELGRETANKIITALKKIFPSNDVDFSKMPEIKYPYPSIDEVVEMNNKAAQDAAAEGLKLLEEAEKSNDVVRRKALED